MTKTVKVKRKRWFNEDTFSLEVCLSGINPAPGQFFQVRTSDTLDPFLNRPISVASYKRGRLLFIIKVVGRGTRLLSEKKEGDDVVVFGPLGKELKLKKRKSLLIAGGIGVAPLYFLAQKLHAEKIDFTFLYGAQRPGDLIMKSNISRIAQKAIFVTERGSRRRMTAIAALRHIDTSTYEIGYTCGPMKMLVKLQALNLQFPIHAFCEDFLGCGCGLCLGCAIKYEGVYKRICEDGPVFELGRIDFGV